MDFVVKTKERAYNLSAGIKWIGSDLLVAIWGGIKPHIGATAVAQPRPSLNNPNVVSATASVICFPGHKEDGLAKATSEILAATLNTKVVVTAGMHWDDISPQGIEAVIKNSEILIGLVLERISANPV